MCVARGCDERLPVGRFVDQALLLVQRFQSTESGAMRCGAVQTKNEHDGLCPANYNWKEDNPRRPSHETPFLCCGRGSNMKITRRIIRGTHASTSKAPYVHEGRDVWVKDTIFLESFIVRLGEDTIYKLLYPLDTSATKC